MTLVKPFEGYDNFVLKQSFQDTIGVLKANALLCFYMFYIAV